MDGVLLSRIQFGISAGVHFIFPPLTLGLSLIILIIEYLYLKKNEEFYKTLSSFLIKILGLIFVLGVATGIVLEFSFGTNWANYSKIVGDIFGAPLAAEGILAFFLESIFLGILLFGRKKVSKRAYFVSALLVFIGSHLSGLWIIIANSWMQTPAGFKMEGGRAILTNFIDAALNHSTIIRYIHTIIASWLTGSLLVCGISSWYFIKKRDIDYAKVLLKIGIIIFIITSLVQLGTGHAHSVQVAKTQPAKMAAYEALWKTQEGAPLALFGIPNEKEEKTYLFIGVPKMLSFLIYLNPNASVQGLNEFPKEERPSVFLPFASYHVMITLGFFFIGLALVGLYLILTKKLETSKWYHWILLLSIPLPHLANEFGWIAAEVGRQPWAVYKVLKTVDAVSITVPSWQILISLIGFTLIYLFLLIIFITLLIKLVKKGPTPISPKES